MKISTIAGTFTYSDGSSHAFVIGTNAEWQTLSDGAEEVMEALTCAIAEYIETDDDLAADIATHRRPLLAVHRPEEVP